MRFRNEDYLRAFPREEKAPIKVTVVERPGNVIEEAEKPEKVIQEPDRGPEPYNGGDHDGDAGSDEPDSQ